MTSVDTSVLVALLQRSHPKHLVCRETMDRIMDEGSVCWSQHLIAELHGALTGTPGPVRLPLRSAQQTIRDLCDMAHVIELDVQDYYRAQERVAAIGIPGGRIFDALHVIGAEKAGAIQLITLNPKHFLPLTQAVDVVGL